MPELPDVEVFRRYAEKMALRKRIAGVWIGAPEMLHATTPARFRTALRARSFVAARRHGKYLFLILDRGRAVVLHFGMTGDLRHYRNTPEEPRHVRIRIDFTDGSHVAYDNMRKFGMVALIDDVGEFIQARRLGPDPLARGFGFETFKKALARKKGAAKAVLTDQATLAGIGNIYADEILFQTGIHPQQNISGLDERQVRELYRTTRRILQRAIAAGADADRMPSRWLLPNRERRGRCPRCGRALETMTVGGRTTYFCPGEQRRQG